MFSPYKNDLCIYDTFDDTKKESGLRLWNMRVQSTLYEKKLCQSGNRERNNRQNLGNLKHTTKRNNKNIYMNKILSTIPLLHTIVIFEKEIPVKGPPYRRQVVRPRPQTPQKEPVAK